MQGIRFTTLMDRLQKGEGLGVNEPVLVTHSSLGPRDAEEGVVYPLAKDQELTLGRNREADIVIESPEVSRRHCSVAVHEQGPKRVTITDLGTRNGTNVNGRAVPRGRPVAISGRIASLRLADRASLAIMDPKHLEEYLWILIRARARS
jgi:hypothetical protein